MYNGYRGIFLQEQSGREVKLTDCSLLVGLRGVYVEKFSQKYSDFRERLLPLKS
jgi:hypothetical protein